MRSKRKKHPSKEIEAVIRYAEKKGWLYREAGKSAHAWGRLLPPCPGRKKCSIAIWSTPSDPTDHARQILQRVKNYRIES